MLTLRLLRARSFDHDLHRAMIDFPASPTVGQTFTAAGVTWTYDGVKWGLTAAAGAPMSTGDNRIINGDMRIDQRNNGAGGNASGYTIDRWVYGGTQAGKGSWQRAGPGSPVTTGFPYNLSFTSSSAYASVASDAFQFTQKIEADLVSDFAWGTATAQPATLSFWVNSNLTGIFSGSIGNGVGTRSYPFSYSIPTANVWTRIVVPIAADTGGAWTLSGNGVGVAVNFDLGSGANFRGPANVWASNNYVGVTGAVSLVSNNGAGFYVTGVKLEIGSVATPYNRQSLAKSLADCQRYYQQYVNFVIAGYTSTGAYIANQFTYPVLMRSSPTITPYTQAYANASGLVINNFDTTAARLNILATATGPGSAIGGFNMSAEL